MYTIKRVVASYKVLDEIGASRMAVACFLRLAVASIFQLKLFKSCNASGERCLDEQ